MPAPRVYQVTGIVLSRFELGEADRVLTVLTPDLGKVRVIAKGVRRPTSRLGGTLEPFAELRLQLARGRTFDVVTQARVLHAWLQLRDRLESDALEVLHYATDHIADQIQVPELAASFEVSISTLERRCERWRLPTPGRLLLWLRVLHGLRWLLEPGRSVESVGHQLGYSSGAAFRRAIKATIGGRGNPLRNAEAMDRALNQFVGECGGSMHVTRIMV